MFCLNKKFVTVTFFILLEGRLEASIDLEGPARATETLAQCVCDILTVINNKW